MMVNVPKDGKGGPLHACLTKLAMKAEEPNMSSAASGSATASEAVVATEPDATPRSEHSCESSVEGDDLCAKAWRKQLVKFDKDPG